MKNKQKGFVISLVIAIVVLLIISGGVYVYLNKKNANNFVVNFSDIANNVPTSAVNAKEEVKVISMNSKVITDIVATGSIKVQKNINCASKGQVINSYGMESEKFDVCCPGLKLSSPYAWIEGRCEGIVGMAGSVCISCGDGICEYNRNENICTCPEDCKKAKKDCAGKNEEITKEGNTSWLLTWLPEKCCQGLTASEEGGASDMYICK